MSPKTKCVVILSTKSSGSSALQRLLCDFGGGRHARHTRHGEFETLYWTKAASVLGLPQVSLPDSEVDRSFGFRLDERVAAVALRYGYSRDEIANEKQLTWRLRRTLSIAVDRTVFRPFATLRRQIRRRISGATK